MVEERSALGVRAVSAHLRRAGVGVLAALAVLALGCGRLGFEIASDAGTDVGVDAARDASGDAGNDAAVDARSDAGCQPSADPCVELHRLADAPTIDGVIEPCLVPAAITPVGWTGATPLPESLHARAAYAWRPDGIYFYVEVDDPDLHPAMAPDDPYCGDGIEVYVDDDGAFATAGAYDIPGTIQLVATAPSTPSGSSNYGGHWALGGPHGLWIPPRYAMVGRPGGYALETLVQARDLGLPTWSLTAGQQVGLDVSINVSTPDGSAGTSANSCGSRQGQFFLHVTAGPPSCGGAPFCDSRAFCTPALR